MNQCIDSLFFCKRPFSVNGVTTHQSDLPVGLEDLQMIYVDLQIQKEQLRDFQDHCSSEWDKTVAM